MTIKDITGEVLNAIIIKEPVVVIDFYSSDCGPCKMLLPVLEKLADETKLPIYKVDVFKTSCAPAVQKFQIRQLPTLIVFKNGTPFKQFVGVVDKLTIKNAILNAED